jgi:predicted transcriptional regulator
MSDVPLALSDTANRIKRVLEQRFGPFGDGVVDRMAMFTSVVVDDVVLDTIQQARADAYAEALEAAAKGVVVETENTFNGLDDWCAQGVARTIRALPNPYREKE